MKNQTTWTYRVGWAALLLLPLAAGCGGVWHHDLDSGLRQARNERKRVLVQFHTLNEACWEMDNKVFGNESVRKMLDQYFVKVRVDGAMRPAWAAAYRIEVLPTFIVFRADGSLSGSRAGAMSADAFRGFLAKNIYE